MNKSPSSSSFAKFAIWNTCRIYSKDPDGAATGLMVGGIGVSLSALAIAACLNAPRQIKFALLTSAFGISTGWVFYESRHSTKQLRLLTHQQRRARTTRLLTQLDNRAKAGQLQDYVTGSQQVDLVLEGVGDPALRAAYAEVAEAKYGVIPVASMGRTADAEPMTVDVEPTMPDSMTFSPSPPSANPRPSTPFEEYMSSITDAVTAKSGGDGSLPIHLAAEARSRSGKSILCECFLYSRLRHAIANDYRVVPLVISAHPRMAGPMRVQWCGLPDLPRVPGDEIKPGFIYADPDDFPGSLLDAVSLLSEQFQARKHGGAPWEAGPSQDPLYLLIVDEIQDYLEAMTEIQVNDLILKLNPILRGGSKFGIGFWAIGHDFVQRKASDPQPISVGALKNMIHMVGLEELKTRARLNGMGAKAATETMERRELEGLPTGLYSGRGGYFEPGPIRSTKQLRIEWEIDQRQLVLQRLSMINVLRQLIATMGTSQQAMEDEMILLLAEQSSNFLPSEISPHLPEIRALLALSDTEYQTRHADYCDRLSQPT